MLKKGRLCMKKLFTIIISLLILLSLSACSVNKGSIEAFSENESLFVITFDNAGEDMSTSAELTLQEGQIFTFDHDLEIDDRVKVEYKDSDGQVVMDLDLSDAGGGQTYLQPGTYTIDVKVIDKANGSLTITVDMIDSDEIANPWKTSEDMQEALDATGLKFNLPIKEALPAEVEYYTSFYTDDIVQILFADTDNYLYFRVSKNHEGKEDLAGDYNEYPEIWHESIKGLDVTCYGKDGQIYLATFTSADQNYSINYNFYPDEKGLTPDELNSLLNGM